MARCRAVLTLFLLLACSPLLQPPPAGAQSDVDGAARALRRNPVYVDPRAERALTDGEAEDLAARIREAEEPIFVAVLPSSAAGGGDVEKVLTDLAARTGLSGTYAAVVGNGFRATSTKLADADEIATAAFQARSGDGTFAVLDEFVRRVAVAGSAAGPASDRPSGAPGQAQGAGDGADAGGGGSLVPLAVLAAGGGGLWVWSRRRRRRREDSDRAELQRSMDADRQMLRAQLSVLADDVMRLEPEVTLHPDARNDYEAATERYRVASAALDYADEPIDLVRVQRVIEEARYAMARARAITQGRTPPQPPEELRHEGPRREPALDVDEYGSPVYAGGTPFYGGGWFGGGLGGGLLGGLLMGSMLGGFGPMGGWGGDHIEINDHGDGDGDGGGWGDMGGGDWGGDFGGGDW
ncbi:MAG: hypothetical protein JWM47_1874 [Acidimicrobiales bacterium]|nr:hypothetical protein [Acidimicrobiales bacterium]